ncbi:DUF637 domain-containing protein, partial [Pseudomonas triclosanedens]
GNQINLLAANDSDYSLYDMKKKGSWGKKKTQHDETTVVNAIGSGIEAGGGIRLVSGGDQHYQGANLKSGDAISVYSGGKIYYEAVKDTKQSSHDKSSSSLAWNSAKGKGKTNETLRQTEMLAQNGVAIHAVEGLQIDYKNLSKKSVSQAIDAMVKADPGLAWIKEAEARGDVDWRAVKEIHDSYSHSSSGLGVGAQLAIAILVAYFTAGAASGLVASGASAAGASTATGSAWAAASASASAGWANAAATAAISSAASTQAISTINNRGNPVAVLRDTFNSDSLKNYAIAATTAGLTTGLYNGWTGTQTGAPVNGQTSGLLANGSAVSPVAGLNSWQGIGQFAANQLLQNGTSTVLSKALGQGGSLNDALQRSLANTFAAFGFNLVGNAGLVDGSPSKIALHALMGGLASEAAGQDFRTGALAAGVNEAVVGALADQYASMPKEKRDSLLVMNSQLIGLLAASAAPNADGESLQTGAWVAGTATQYNFLLHEEIQERAKEIKDCGGKDECEQDVIKRYAALDKARNEDLPGLCRASPAQCMVLMKQLASERGLNEAAIDSMRFESVNAAIGVYLAAESNEGAIDTIQLELLRNKYGDGAVVAAQLLQMAAAGSLARNAKAVKGTTSLFRAVGPAELADINATNALRNLGSAEGKYFTTSAEEAAAYAKQAVKAFGDQPYTIIKTDVPNSIFKGLSPTTVDRGIPAWVIPTDRLPGLVPQVMNYSPLPPRKF